MQVSEVIKKRRSVRKFTDKKASDEQIKKLLEAASWAPSAGNLQSYFLVVVRDQETKERLASAALGQSFVAKASVVFVACADTERSASRYGQRGADLYAVQDATLALYNLWLAAVEMGLAGVWIGAFDEKKVSEFLKLPPHLRPVAVLPIGYPAESPSPPSRKPLKEISKEI